LKKKKARQNVPFSFFMKSNVSGFNTPDFEVKILKKEQTQAGQLFSDVFRIWHEN